VRSTWKSFQTLTWARIDSVGVGLYSAKASR